LHAGKMHKEIDRNGMFVAGYALLHNISRATICHSYHQSFYQYLPLFLRSLLPKEGVFRKNEYNFKKRNAVYED